MCVVAVGCVWWRWVVGCVWWRWVVVRVRGEGVRIKGWVRVKERVRGGGGKQQLGSYDI
jgi:hypothetical protein